ncbi:hypothetical protein RRG08_025818 [Elysia crispata]|uniref:Sulfotransferase domain-containing protein n=1 Tax=Elysia crispata TaxID=231223 RepID=A0AAE1CSA6_9GAST|nr:hypothetical protein RRG08_025818 [Elysia crispata]
MADVEVVELPDGGGNTLRVKKYGGRFWPDFPSESIIGVESLLAREDDVILVSYPKSGSHWVWEIICFLMAGTTEIVVADKEVGMIGLVRPELLEAQPSPRILNTHAHFELMPRDVFNKKTCKLIYVTRDPRDVAVSYYNNHKKLVQYYSYTGHWKDYLTLYLNGQVDYESWFAYTRGWEQGIRDNPDLLVHVTSYEALHYDITGEIYRLAKFLGVEVDAPLVEQIVSETSFATMRQTKGAREIFGGVRPSSPVMYRKGKVGDWKNWFTVAQSEQFNAVFDQEMAGTKAFELYSHSKQGQTASDENTNETERNSKY